MAWRRAAGGNLARNGQIHDVPPVFFVHIICRYFPCIPDAALQIGTRINKTKPRLQTSEDNRKKKKARFVAF
jgi:hypothetical protein